MLSLEEGDYGEHAAMVVLGLAERQLGQDAAHVLLDGALGHPQLAGDTSVGSAFGHELEDLPLTRRQVAERVCDRARGDELPDQRGVDDRAAVGDPLDVLEEVARPR